MIAEIVAIGTELLMGQIADSDAQMLSRELQSLGIAVYHHQPALMCHSQIVWLTNLSRSGMI